MGNESIYVTGAYLRDNASLHVEDSEWKAQQILRMLEKHRLQPEAVVEVGCGAGEILRQLQSRLSAEVTFTGYDISPQGIELAQRNENERLKFFCQGIDAIQDHVNDLVLCIDVFEHVEDYFGFLRTLHKKGTYKVFHIPLDLTVFSVLRNVPPRRRKAVGHIHYFTKDIALLALQDTGYDIVDWCFTPANVDQTKTMGARLLKMPRRIAFRISQELTVRILGGYSLLVLAK